MKVLLLTTHLEMGGISVYVAHLARGLKRLGHEPLVASSGGWLENRLQQEEIPHFQVSCRTSSELNPKLWSSAFPRLLALVRRERPDLLHAHTRVSQVLAWALSNLTGTPFVTTCHGLYRYRLGRRFFRCWGKWVMAISGPSRDRLVRQYRLAPPHQVVLIPNGVEVDFFLEPVAPEEVQRFKEAIGLQGQPIVGAIARLSPIKGLDFFLRAVPGLLSDFPRLQLLLVGDGPAKGDLVRLAYELGIQERVVIVHPVEDTRIPLACMEAFVAPSLREGFGLAMVEAMAAGVPVVASNAGGPAEIVEDGKNGFLIPPGDSGAIERALRSLLTEPELKTRIGQQGRLRAQERYDMKRVVQEVEKVYARAISAKE